MTPLTVVASLPRPLARRTKVKECVKTSQVKSSQARWEEISQNERKKRPVQVPASSPTFKLWFGRTFLSFLWTHRQVLPYKDIEISSTTNERIDKPTFSHSIADSVSNLVFNWSISSCLSKWSRSRCFLHHEEIKWLINGVPSYLRHNNSNELTNYDRWDAPYLPDHYLCLVMYM